MKIITVIKEMTKDEFYRRLAKILFPGYHLTKFPEKGLRRRKYGPDPDAMRGLEVTGPGERSQVLPDKTVAGGLFLPERD